jgi:hypothetical protein
MEDSVGSVSRPDAHRCRPLLLKLEVRLLDCREGGSGVYSK